MGDVNLKDYFKNFEDKLLVKMPKQEEADITSGKMVLIFTEFRLYAIVIGFAVTSLNNATPP